MTKSAKISPFAELAPPPPPVIVLLEATELHIAPSATLLAFEDLPPRAPLTSADHGMRFHPYSRRETPTTLPADRPQFSPSLPSPHPPPALPSTSLPQGPPVAEEEELDMSPLTSPASSPRSSPAPQSQPHTSLRVTSAKVKIERPKGAARKNLQDQVKWDPAFLNEIKKYARQMVHAHLNTALCFKDQEPTKLTLVRQAMVQKFPRLDDYEHLWPLDIMIINLLKYSSSHGKGISQRNVVNAVRGVVGSNTPNSRPRRSMTSGQI